MSTDFCILRFWYRHLSLRHKGFLGHAIGKTCFCKCTSSSSSICPWALLIVIATAFFKTGMVNPPEWSNYGKSKHFHLFYSNHNYCLDNISSQVCNLLPVLWTWHYREILHNLWVFFIRQCSNYPFTKSFFNPYISLLHYRIGDLM